MAIAIATVNSNSSRQRQVEEQMDNKTLAFSHAGKERATSKQKNAMKRNKAMAMCTSNGNISRQ